MCVKEREGTFKTKTTNTPTTKDTTTTKTMETTKPKQHTITRFIFDDLIGDKTTFKISRDGVLREFL